MKASEPTSSAKLYEKYWSGTAWLLVSVVFRLVLSIGSSILFVRYLGDKDYGKITVLADFISIAIVFVSFGLGVAQTRVVPQLYAQELYGEVRDVTIKLISYRFLASALLALVLLFYKDVAIKTLFNGIDERLYLVMVALLLVQMISTCLRGALEVTYHQKAVSLGEMSSLTFRLALALVVIYFDLGIIVFFVTQLVADVYAVILYSYVFNKEVWKKLSDAVRAAYTGPLWRVGLISMCILFAGKCLGKEMDTQILLFRLHEAAFTEIAVYSISFLIVSRALSFVGVGVGGISNLTQSVMSEFKQKNDMAALNSIYISQLKMYYFISIPLIFGSLAVAERLLVVMYGSSFVGQGLICTLLFLFLGGTLINVVNYTVLFSCGLEMRILLSRFIWGVINAALSFYMAKYGALGVTIATGVSLIGLALYETVLVFRILNPQMPMLFFCKVVAGSAIMALAMHVLQYFDQSFNQKVLVVLVIVSGMVVFYLMMLLLKPLEMSYIHGSKLKMGLLKKMLLSIAR